MPTNKRFAEERRSLRRATTAPGANPKLYRVSVRATTERTNGRRRRHLLRGLPRLDPRRVAERQPERQRQRDGATSCRAIGASSPNAASAPWNVAEQTRQPPRRAAWLAHHRSERAICQQHRAPPSIHERPVQRHGVPQQVPGLPRRDFAFHQPGQHGAFADAGPAVA
ncbi:MAG: hypothetical protein MZV63_21540 [Marinilabiliales bacterium]|nr:hypothetical protein [Marinilabiliales bacterium]